LNPRRAIAAMLPDSIIGRARDARKRWRAMQGRRFIRLEEIDYRSLLKNPDPPDSPQFQAELQEIRRLQQALTAEEMEHAADEAFVRPDFFARVLGSHFNSHVLPRTFAFLQELMWADAAVVEPIKDFYARKRPYEIDPQLKPRIELEKTPGYPSGHAARLLILASTLAEIFGGQKESLCRLAAEIPARRVKVGMHFPSDIEAGRILGEFIYSRMREKPAFQSRLSKAERECRAAGH
jgi:acid phosphatase (class A)